MLPILIGGLMNKKLIPLVVQLKQNNREILTGINQNDAGVLFDIKIMDGLETFDFSGYSVVTLKIQKPDGTFTYDASTSEYLDIVDPVHGRLKINVPTSCTAQNGMHFCTVGFGYDETTYFETLTFNYFVGENPNVDDEDVIGTNEFPVLSNLIAQISSVLSAEQVRTSNEEDRVDAEAERQASYTAIVTAVNNKLTEIQNAYSNLQSMLQELNEAIAEGGSVDISQITALATKTWVEDYASDLNYGDTATGKSGRLTIYHGTDADIGTLNEGEFGYATDTNRLYIGGSNGKALINEPCFVATASAPMDTTKLWIDISGTAPVIKYYDGTTWVNCNTAVFA